ncbi:hypothetical protein [Tuwongella immobilis]|uniref:Uncharacterized protein n=1 Tax=Tuwongella immobilis TaxID=692036 RepID=A0A6C2YL79_9BACT|nr:hypothetical protein [Tuwongella immobilis]VIP02186.1 Uncharacterized protein OS=Paenibacillus sp. FSL R7-277 GN=C173_14065 PE=4 SV=1 [Tuwongella immobilis]VTS00645.1 Uncharacterized protein OS=Paenibacillus sp. FSL R7-277 GN=C173_14065 PE=4 SV=1 [Tuwongella immobilis]
MTDMQNAMIRLAQQLKLPLPDPYSQDWANEVADSSRVAEWLSAYESGHFDSLEMSLLMTIILESFNDLLGDGAADFQMWKRIEQLLVIHRAIHADSITHGSLNDEANPDNWFPLTHWMRLVRDQLPTTSG